MSASRPRLLLTRPVDPAAIAVLEARCEVAVLPFSDAAPLPTEAELLAAVPPVELLFTLPGHPVTARVIAAAPQLRMIATLGAGYDNIDLAAAAARAIPVTHAPGILDETVADLTFALLLASARRLPEAERTLRRGEFRGWYPAAFLGQDVHGKTLGIVGMGRIGAAVARRARGFSMTVLYSSPRPKPDLERELGASRVGLDALLGASDFVCLHVPLTPQTRHLIGPRELGLMKPTAHLINTARGPVVDEAALAEALGERKIAGAGLDVFEQEPAVHPGLLALENVVLAPHIGSATADTRRRMALRAAENLIAFLDQRPLPHRVPSPPAAAA